LLVTGIKRLTAHGGDPVVQLQTAFGGGKTHSMLALYHLSGGQIELKEASVTSEGSVDSVIQWTRGG
jgi:predicted AAA+ superfamily ATPase